MDWDKLRIFQAAADAGSFTHAGETLGLSQSAVSRQVGALEHDLGAPLFHRHARGLILTDLAGAMGKPVWVLLSSVPAWHWMLNRTDCPWYPTMRLFRQATPGDWTGVVENLTRAMSK